MPSGYLLHNKPAIKLLLKRYVLFQAGKGIMPGHPAPHPRSPKQLSVYEATTVGYRPQLLARSREALLTETPQNYQQLLLRSNNRA